jgi:uncharacterized membrane protein
MRYLAAYGAALLVCVGLDFSWMAVVAHGFYAHEIGALLRARIRLAPAAGFYLLYIAGVTAFVVAPSLERGGWRRAARLGGVFGLVAYGTYDLTNLATLKGFTAAVAAVDMAWGALVTAIAASAGHAAGRRTGGRG